MVFDEIRQAGAVAQFVAKPFLAPNQNGFSGQILTLPLWHGKIPWLTIAAPEMEAASIQRPAFLKMLAGQGSHP